MIARTSLPALLALALPLALAACTTDGTGAAAGAGAGPAAKFFLPTGEPDNTVAPRVEVDAKGGIHAVYPAYAGGRAYYAYCAAGCAGHEQVSVVRFDTNASVANAMIALDGEGRPRVLLSTFDRVYYAACDADCGEQGSWTSSVVLDHGGEREVTGEAFALDPQGRPRFVMHTYEAYLGVGQKAPQAFYVACDADCTEPSRWTASKIADEMWRGSSLRFDADGVAKLATVATLGATQDSSGTATAAYLECAAGCTTQDDWKGIAFAPAYENQLEAVPVKPSISLALTPSGAPRVAVLAKNEDKKAMIYFHCDEGCTGDNWQGSIVSDHARLGAGLDLAVDKDGHPRLAYTLDYNIGLAWCDDANCAAENAKWDLTKVELGSGMPADQIFLWPNCNVGAWFLHSPSVALTADGAPRVGYQARDISGGWSNPDKDKPRCEAGTDMTLTRLSTMTSYK